MEVKIFILHEDSKMHSYYVTYPHQQTTVQNLIDLHKRHHPTKINAIFIQRPNELPTEETEYYDI